LKSRGLKCIAAKHKETETQSRENLFARERTKKLAARPQRHHNSRKRETQRKKQKHGRVVERVFYNDKRRSPKNRAERKSNIRAQPSGLLRNIILIHFRNTGVAYFNF